MNNLNFQYYKLTEKAIERLMYFYDAKGVLFNNAPASIFTSVLLNNCVIKHGFDRVRNKYYGKN